MAVSSDKKRPERITLEPFLEPVLASHRSCNFFRASEPKVVSQERHDQPEHRPDADDEEPDHDIEPNRLPRLDSSILFPLAALLKPSDRFLDRVWMSAMWALLGST